MDMVMVSVSASAVEDMAVLSVLARVAQA